MAFSFNIIRGITPLDPEIVFTIANYKIASSTMMTFLIVVVVALFVFFSVRKFKERPGTWQALVEIMYESLVSFIEQITQNRKRAEMAFPVIGAMFVYLVMANLIGLFPGLTDIYVGGKPLFRTATSDFNTTFGLALGSVIAINAISLREWGAWEFFNKFIKIRDVWNGFRKGIGSGAMALVNFFVGLLDIVGEFAKVLSLSLRLFGNMYAGQVLMIIFFGAVAYIIPSVWLAMSLFVGFLQGLVFASLVAVYYISAVKEDETS